MEKLIVVEIVDGPVLEHNQVKLLAKIENWIFQAKMILCCDKVAVEGVKIDYKIYA